MLSEDFKTLSSPSKSDWERIYARVLPYIHRTEVMENTTINKLAGCQIYFKCENMQKIGAFKMRGAVNAALSLPVDELSKGLATHSSGNFAQAVALCARMLNVPAYIVMPSNAPNVKKDAVRGYGAQVIECPPTQADREATVEAVVKEKGATFLHPYNQWTVMYGQGTAAVEFHEQVPDLDAILAPVGGGGLISGTAMATDVFAPKCKIYGAEPENANDAQISFRTGVWTPVKTPNTVADGLRTSTGDRTFYVICRYLEDILTVSEEQIIEAMRLVWERMKIIIEPSSAVPLAAVLANRELFNDKKVGIILSGGNVDASVYFDSLG